jgi:hypothetical protein
VDSCPRNFRGEELATFASENVLDQETLSTVLAAIDAAFSTQQGVAPGTRVDIADLLAGSALSLSFDE